MLENTNNRFLVPPSLKDKKMILITNSKAKQNPTVKLNSVLSL